MIEKNFLYLDNKSTILLAKNVRMSAGNNSKHIKNRFFLITDKVSQRELEIRHMYNKSCGRMLTPNRYRVRYLESSDQI